MSQSSEFYHHNPLCSFSVSDYCCLFCYQLCPKTFGYTLTYSCLFYKLTVTLNEHVEYVYFLKQKYIFQLVLLELE